MTESTFIQSGVGGTHVDVLVKEITKLIPIESDKITKKSEDFYIHKNNGKSN